MQDNFENVLPQKSKLSCKRPKKQNCPVREIFGKVILLCSTRQSLLNTRSFWHIFQFFNNRRFGRILSKKIFIKQEKYLNKKSKTNNIFTSFVSKSFLKSATVVSVLYLVSIASFWHSCSLMQASLSASAFWMAAMALTLAVCSWPIASRQPSESCRSLIVKERILMPIFSRIQLRAWIGFKLEVNCFDKYRGLAIRYRIFLVLYRECNENENTKILGHVAINIGQSAISSTLEPI